MISQSSSCTDLSGISSFDYSSLCLCNNTWTPPTSLRTSPILVPSLHSNQDRLLGQLPSMDPCLLHVDLELSESLALTLLPLLCRTAQHLGHMRSCVMCVIQLSQWGRELASGICRHTYKSVPAGGRTEEGPSARVSRAETVVWFLPINSVLALSLNGIFRSIPPSLLDPELLAPFPPLLVFSRILFGVTCPTPAEPRGGGKKVSFLSKACLSLATQHSYTFTPHVSSSLS